MTTIQDLINSPGWQATDRIGAFSEMHNIFNQNDKELKELFQKIYNDTQLSREVFFDVWGHLSQRVFNYVSAARALVDHANKMMTYYKELDIYQIYKTKVNDTFSDNKQARFITGLRNYLTHYKIESPTPVRSLTSPENWEVVFSVSELLQHPDQWNTANKKFIKDCGQEINLNKLFSEYTDSINRFYLWLYALLKEHHKKDFEEKNELMKRLGLGSKQTWTLSNILSKLPHNNLD